MGRQHPAQRLIFLSVISGRVCSDDEGNLYPMRELRATLNGARWLFFLLVTIISYSCNDFNEPDVFGSTVSRGSGYARRIQLNYSHADSIEAGNFAVWYSGQNRPSDSLISELLYSLNYLRYAFDDSIRFQNAPVLQQRFLAPWVVSELLLKVDDTTAHKINLGQYDGWNRLDEYLRPAHHDSADVLGWLDLHFNGFLHPRRLGELYRQLPGVIDWEENLIALGDWSAFPIYPSFDGENWSYLFSAGYGPWSLTDWYFKYAGGVPHYVGVWNPGEPEPPWWNEVQNGIDFVHWDGPPH